MTREYSSKNAISGWYYDIQSDPDQSRMTCVSLHPNAIPSGSKWVKAEEAKDTETDPDDDKAIPAIKYKYAKEPICASIFNEDFNVSIANSWSDFGGDMLGQMWESIKPLAPYAGFAQNAIHRMAEQYRSLQEGNADDKARYNKIQEADISRGLAEMVINIDSKVNNQDPNKRVDIAEYLNRSLVMQGTRFSYYSGTGTSFGNLIMKFTILPRWKGGTFETVNYQVSKILPYVMGKFIKEDVLTTPDLDGIVGWQVPPGGFKADMKHVDNVQFGTLKLKFGAHFAITNLVCESATFSFSKQMLKCPPARKGGTKLGGQDDNDNSPEELMPQSISSLYCDATIQLKPATKYSDESVRNFVFGNQTQVTLEKVNKQIQDNLDNEKEVLEAAYGNRSLLSFL